MKSTEFKAWMKSIERMSRHQRDKLRKSLEGKEDADEVIALIERNQHDKLAGSERAGQRAATIQTLLGTAQLNGLNPADWLNYKTTRMAK